MSDSDRFETCKMSRICSGSILEELVGIKSNSHSQAKIKDSESPMNLVYSSEAGIRFELRCTPIANPKAMSLSLVLTCSFQYIDHTCILVL